MPEHVPAAPETGYAPVNGLQMYYELHGAGGTPLLLLHGGLFDIEQQFGALIPGLSEGRRVIATDFQGHGRTNDIDRPLNTRDLAASSDFLTTWTSARSTFLASASEVRSRCMWQSTVRSLSASSWFHRCHSGPMVTAAETPKR